MYFKSLSVYRYQTEDDLTDIDSILSQRAFRVVDHLKRGLVMD